MQLVTHAGLQISVSTAESCTGGLLAAQFTSKSGISQIYQTGLITYSNEAKMKHLKVKASTLKSHGAVSMQVCSQMTIKYQNNFLMQEIK